MTEKFEHVTNVSSGNLYRMKIDEGWLYLHIIGYSGATTMQFVPTNTEIERLRSLVIHYADQAGVAKDEIVKHGII